jgi:predicted ATPase
MLERSIDAYQAHASAPSPVFFDRGIPDTLGYARLIGLPDTSAIEDACHTYRYAPAIFLAPPWEEIYATDGERKQDFEEAARTFEILRAVYMGLEYEVLELPKAPPPARARFILERLGC